MLEEFDSEADTLNIIRQAVIKTMLRDSLDRRYLAKQARRAGLFPTGSQQISSRMLCTFSLRKPCCCWIS